MSETASATVTYTPLESGDEEIRWIRLEQTQATLPGPPSLGPTAEMIDLLYGIDPCADGLGGGGEAAGDDPDVDEVEESLALLLDDAGLCRQGHWLAAMNVYRTHEQPGYELRSATATVERVEPVEESFQQVVDVNGPLIALERPYAGGLTGIPTGVGWTVRGGTVNMDRPVRDRLTLRYQTKYERVTLRVPTLRTDEGEEYEAAAVAAFWGDMAAECELEPPEPESEEDRQAREDICRKRRPEPSEPGGCWKILKHYQRCECSNRLVEEWEEQVPAPCDGFRAGAFIGYEHSFDGYTDCGEREDVHDPEFYKQRCCEYPPTPLPRCREMRRVYRGGHEIEGGPEHWKNIYGENVIMRPVLPEGGVCGDEITRWNVPQKNCCDGVPPLVPSPDNPTNIEPGATYLIKVGGGKSGILTWKAHGGLTFLESGTTTYRTASRGVYVVADDNVCPHPSITVDDGCSPLVMTFEGTASAGPSLPDDMEIAAETSFSVSVSGGVPGYMWTSSGVDLLGWSADGSTAYFKTGKIDEWCVATVSVSDACGRDAEMTIMNASRGQWVQMSDADYDACDPPGAPFQFERHGNQRIYGKSRNGYRVVAMCGSSQRGKTEGGSCTYRYAQYLPGGSEERYNCPTGNEIVVGYSGCVHEWCNGERNNYTYVYESSGCCKRYYTRYPDDPSLTTYTPRWQYAWELYKWVCS